LINKTISDDLVKHWIKKNRHLLECEKRDRKDFEKYVRHVERELKEKKNLDYPDEKDSHDKLFPHEFLFLLCNTRNRIDMISKLPKPEFTTERKSIKQYDMQPLDALRLDHIYKIDLRSIGKDQKSDNPKDVL
jgi:hypothetical protein